MASILFVLTAASELRLRDGSVLATGFWAQEFVAPYHIFLEHGHTVDIATPNGRAAALDALCLDPRFHDHDIGRAENLREQLEAIDAWRSPLSLERLALTTGSHDAVFFPGGHGPMADLAENAAAGNLVKRVYANNGLIGAVCHGPAALIPAMHGQRWLFADFAMTCFSREEERLAGLDERLPWLLADQLAALGAQLSHGAPGAANMVADRRLYTGQNPASAAPLAWDMARELKKRTARDKTACGTPCA